MAVFPKRPDLHDEQATRDYIKYMVERLEFMISQLEKELADLKGEINNG